jgi:quinol monooxygenase YgiN
MITDGEPKDLPAAAHKFHLEQNHTKQMFAALDGKLAEAPIMTNLSAP